MMTENDWIPISKERPPADKWLFVVYRYIASRSFSKPISRRRGIGTAHTFFKHTRHGHQEEPCISTPGSYAADDDVTHWMIQPDLSSDDWIPISKKPLPPNQQLFVAYRLTTQFFVKVGRTSGYHVTIAHTFDSDDGKHTISWYPGDIDVTHWMIQPSLPKDD